MSTVKRLQRCTAPMSSSIGQSVLR